VNSSCRSPFVEVCIGRLGREVIVEYRHERSIDHCERPSMPFSVVVPTHAAAHMTLESQRAPFAQIATPAIHGLPDTGYLLR
jgi:hypothetical protein